MAGKMGQRIMDARISIWDDGLDPAGLPLPFDFEGVPKQRVDLIAEGVARGVVYDSATAAKEEGKVSTGHALPAPNTQGPVPQNLFLAPGDTPVEEMVRSTERGVYVTRFHYTRPVEPVRLVVTGMTRDGTFPGRRHRPRGAAPVRLLGAVAHQRAGPQAGQLSLYGRDRILARDQAVM